MDLKPLSDQLQKVSEKPLLKYFLDGSRHVFKVDEFIKILWMTETFIIYRRIYDINFRVRLANRYTTVTKHDCDLTGEWWEKFKALTTEKLEKAKSIIALNRFKDGDYLCEDKEINDVLAYYKITHDDTENNQ